MLNGLFVWQNQKKKKIQLRIWYSEDSEFEPINQSYCSPQPTNPPGPISMLSLFYHGAGIIIFVVFSLHLLTSWHDLKEYDIEWSH